MFLTDLDGVFLCSPHRPSYHVVIFLFFPIFPLGPLCFFLVLALSVSLVLLFFFFSVPNLFLFTSSPVFCSVSRFKSFPFKSVFLWIWQSKIPRKRGKNKLWLLCFCFFLLQLRSLKKKKKHETKQNRTEHEEGAFGIRIGMNWIRSSSFTESQLTEIVLIAN